ncbi:MAG: ATP-binding protein [Hyphomonadaceae bacterium JAD_PAG50586_4]|nr:MAG: ATP-binding protein [Hyphomonadaceae bacterium JAD_PAG50586_4]
MPAWAALRDRYQARLSAPLLDRIDIQLDVPSVTAADLALPPPHEGTAEAAARVMWARAAQSSRGAGLNAVLDQASLERVATPRCARGLARQG